MSSSQNLQKLINWRKNKALVNITPHQSYLELDPENMKYQYPDFGFDDSLNIRD